MAITRSRHRCQNEAFGRGAFLLSKLTPKWLQPPLHPRFALGMALTILSLAAVERADFNPMRIWDAAEDKVIRVKDGAVKYCENLRFVYQLERRLMERQEHQEVSELQRGSAPRPGRQANGGTERGQ